jgi:hypothetical protein
MSGCERWEALGAATNTFGSTATYRMYCIALYHYISVWSNSGCLSFLLRVRLLPALFTFVLQRLMQRDRNLMPHDLQIALCISGTLLVYPCFETHAPLPTVHYQTPSV